MVGEEVRKRPRLIISEKICTRYSSFFPPVSEPLTSENFLMESKSISKESVFGVEIRLFW